MSNANFKDPAAHFLTKLSDLIERNLDNQRKKQCGRSKYMPHQGKKERARRRRQMGLPA